MTDREELAATVREVFHEALKVETDKLKPETVLRDELGLDSLDMIEVVYAIEERFEVQIPEEKLGEISTFGQVLAGLEQALAAKEG